MPPRAGCRSAATPRCGEVAVVGELRHQRSGELATAARAPDQGPSPAAHLPSFSPPGRARCPMQVTSMQPWFGQLPWHGGPSLSITMWPSSAPRSDRAAIRRSAEDQPTADPGPDRHHHDLAGANGGAGSMLGEGRHVAVVVDEHRQSEPFSHHIAKTNVLQRKVDGTTAMPVRRSISDGIPNPTAAISEPALLSSSSTAS